jgi:hypothetical protein
MDHDMHLKFRVHFFFLFLTEKKAPDIVLCTRPWTVPQRNDNSA